MVFFRGYLMPLLKRTIPSAMYAALRDRYRSLAWFRRFKEEAVRLGCSTDDCCGYCTRYLTMLLDSGDTRRARRMVRWCMNSPGIMPNLSRNLRIAAFAFECGCRSREINMAARVFKSVKATHASSAFADLVVGRTVAVVGNGPGEVGKGLGGEIDSHDIVVRFNSFMTEGYEADYGTRTDIWSKASIDHIVHERVAGVKSMVVHDRNLECDSLKPGYIEAADDMLNRGLLVDYYPLECREALAKAGCKSPTTGFLMIETLRRAAPRHIDAYGFSFLVEGASQDTYSNLGQKISRERMKYEISFHDIDFEIKYLRKLFGGGRRLQVSGAPPACGGPGKADDE